MFFVRKPPKAVRTVIERLKDQGYQYEVDYKWCRLKGSWAYPTYLVFFYGPDSKGYNCLIHEKRYQTDYSLWQHVERNVIVPPENILVAIATSF